jgi:hypothetical protein
MSAIEWQYRLVVKGGIYSVYEVALMDGRPSMVSTEPVVPTGSTFSEVATKVKNYYEAIRLPALDWDKIGTKEDPNVGQR